MIYLLLSFLLLPSGTLAEQQDSVKIQQKKWNAQVLRDFVRGKGHGSVARLSLQDALSPPNLFEEDDKPLLDLTDPSVVSAGGIYSDDKARVETPQAPRGFSQIIMPTSIIAPASYLASIKKNGLGPAKMESNEHTANNRNVKMQREPKKEQNSNENVLKKSSERVKQSLPKRTNKLKEKKKTAVKEDEPSLESFEELAGLFQQFMTKRKTKSSLEDMPSTVTSPKQAVNLTSLPTTAIGQWESMDPDDVDVDEDQLMPIGKDAWEKKMKQLSEQLSLVLKQIRQTKDQSKSTKPPYEKTVPKKKTVVTILRNGSAEQISDGSYTFLATITLVQDDGKNILVDTGLGTDINGRTMILNKLNSLGLAPPNIDVVVTTHGHPDHSGGINDFPDAYHYQGWYLHKGTRFNLSELFESDRLKLTSNVHLIRTPGHSSDDISVIVREEQSMGTVTISGDVFIRKEDIDYPIMWQPLSANETQQAISRRKLLCSDTSWIIPGHGPPFPVDKFVKAKFKC